MIGTSNTSALSQPKAPNELFSDLIQKLRNNPPKPLGYASLMHLALYDNKPLIVALEKKLEKLGLHHFSYLGQGSQALVLNTSENRVVRLSVVTAESWEKRVRPEHPAILQPISRTIIPLQGKDRTHEIIITVFPKVKKITHDPYMDHLIKQALSLSGLTPLELSNEGNIGVIEFNGKNIPLLIDADMAEYYKAKAQEPKKAMYTNRDHAKLKEALSLWVDEDGTWVQKKWLQEQRRKMGYGATASANFL